MNAQASWSALKDAVLNLVFPPHCVICGQPGEWLCQSCAASFAYVQPPVCALCGRPLSNGHLCHRCSTRRSPLNEVRAATYFEGGARRAIHQFKYKGVRVLAPYLGSVMAQAWHQSPCPVSVIVPVPLHRQRLRQRGYNQSALLAQEVSRRIGLPVVEDCLRRVKQTRPQVGLGMAERRENVQGAFACTGQRLSGEHVLLVDDVCTTGATLEACAQALLNRGAHEVWALVLAREQGDRRPSASHGAAMDPIA